MLMGTGVAVWAPVPLCVRLVEEIVKFVGSRNAGEPMGEKTARSWMRSVRSCVVILIGVWLVYAVVQFMAWHFAREAGRDHQNLAVLPTPLKDTTAEKLSGLRVEKFGFSFQLPWDDVATDRTGKGAAALNFKGGADVLVFDPASAVNSVKIMREGAGGQQSILNRVFGAKTLSSNYDLMAAEVGATSNDVEWWVSRARNIRTFILLEDKLTELGETGKSIHPLASSTVQGFQFGDPDAAPYIVRLELFDSLDRRYEIVLTGKSAHRAVITQSQINGLIASLRTTPVPAVDRPSGSGI
jgi:hypothetical protein